MQRTFLLSIAASLAFIQLVAVEAGAAVATKVREQRPLRKELRRVWSRLTPDQRKAWGAAFDGPRDKAIEKLREICEECEGTQEVRGNAILWRGKKNRAEVMISLIPDSGDLGAVSQIFEDIHAHRPLVTYAIVHQIADGDGQFDIFELSRRRYLEHFTRISVTKPRSKYKPKRPVRHDIRRLFDHLPRSQDDLAWTKALFTKPEVRAKELELLAKQYDCALKTVGEYHLWLDAKAEVQAMFAVPDPTQLDDVRALYNAIKTHRPRITFVLARGQDGMACVFGFWERTWLNHWNQLPKTDTAVRYLLRAEAAGDATARNGRSLPDNLADPKTVLVPGAMELYESVMKETVDTYRETRRDIVTDLLCMRAAKMKDVDYAALMTLSGWGITFAYDRRKEFWRKDMVPPVAAQLVPRGTGALINYPEFKSRDDAWKVLTENVKAGVLLRSSKANEVFFGYRDSEKKGQRTVFAFDAPWVRAMDWADFCKAIGYVGTYRTYSAGKREVDKPAVAREVLRNLVEWSKSHPHAKHWVYSRSIPGLRGLETFAREIGNKSMSASSFNMGWRGGRHIYTQWTGRKCTGSYLARIAGALPGRAGALLKQASSEYEAAHQAWLEWEKNLGFGCPHKAWESKEKRQAGAAAVRKAFEHEKKAVELARKALAVIEPADGEEDF